ncbi:MAG: T9SS type A sorting domain-containing protein [bacterium]|nr:T9SS type A sorting domain-containing protein [bacterium]
MKQNKLRSSQIVFLLFLFFFSFKSYGNHEIGLEISYTCSSTPGVYNVTAKFYRDCNGIQLCSNCPSVLWPNCAKTLNILGAQNIPGSGLPTTACSGTNFGTISLNVVTSISGFDVVQLCNTVKTTCSNCGTRTPGTYGPGIEVYVFTGQANLNALPANCCLISLGYNTCCRNSGITTIQFPSNSNFYSEAIINRCASPCNNSPVFTNTNEHFVIQAGIDQIINLGAVDPDGDSLSYQLAPPLIGHNSYPLYASPYSATIPFPYLGAPTQYPPSAMPFGINIDPLNGNLRFRTIGNFVSNLAILVSQWKTVTGLPTLMGITRRDFQLYSKIGFTGSNPQLMRYNDLNQALGDSLFDVYDTVCAGQTYCRIFVATDLDLTDTTDLSFVAPGNMPGATFTKLYNVATRNTNGPRFDSARFCWTAPLNPQSQPYYFLVTAKDRTCNLVNKTLLSTGIILKNAPTAVVGKVKFSALNYKFKYTKTNTGFNQTTGTFWEIETTPNANTYATYSLDSINSHTFTTSGLHKIRLNLFGLCGYILIKDSIVVSDFSLTLMETRNLSCKNDSSGRFISKRQGGTPPFNYFVVANTGSFPATISYPFTARDTFDRWPANSYKLLVIDSLNNRDSVSFTLTQPLNVVSLAISSSKRPACNGDSNGVIIVISSNTTGLNLYKIGSSSYQSSNTFNNLKAGIYAMRTKDSLGCEASVNYGLTENTPIVFGSKSISNILCKGDSSGSVTQIVTGGQLPYKYRLINKDYQFTNTFNNLKAGLSQFEIRDTNGCVKNFEASIIEPAKLLVSVLTSPTQCLGATTGKAQATVSGGKPPYTYQWQTIPINTTPIVSNLPSGKIVVLVKDTNLCSYADSGIVGVSAKENNEQICLVTVDSVSGKNRVFYNKTAGLGTGTYQIYAAQNTTAIPILIATNTFDSNPIFIDNVSLGLPIGEAYYYTIKALDSCANASKISTAHRPVILLGSGLATKVTLNWNAYIGITTVIGYKVYRSINGAPYTVIAQVGSGMFSWVDSLGGNAKKTYIVEALSSSNCFGSMAILSNKFQVYNVGLKSVSLGLNQFVLYPNPSSAKFEITCSNKDLQISKVIVTNLLGENMMTHIPQSQNHELSINIHNLADGTYHVTVFTVDGLKQTLSLVVEHK